MPGPSIIDLAQMTHTTIHNLFYFVPCGTAGYLLGALICGTFLDKCKNRYVFIGGFILLTSGSVALIPWNVTPSLLAITNLIASLGVGVLEVAGISLIFEMWGTGSQPYMQMLQACLNMGCLMAPLIIKPFLMPTAAEEDGNPLMDAQFYKNVLSSYLSFGEYWFNYTHSNTASPLNHSTAIYLLPENVTHFFELENSTLFDNSSTIDDTNRSHHPKLDIRFAFGITAIINLISAIWFLSTKDKPKNERAHVASEADMVGDGPLKQNMALTVQTQAILVTLAALLVILTTGNMVTYGAYLSTFVVKSDLHLTKATGAIMTFIFWATVIFGRGAFIVFAKYVSLSQNIALASIVILLGTIILYVSTLLKSVVGLWVSTGVLGFGWSPFFAFVFSFLNQFVPISPKISTIINVAYCAGMRAGNF